MVTIDSEIIPNFTSMKNSYVSFFKGFAFAFNGLSNAIQTERNLKVHLIISIMVCLLGWYVQLPALEWCIILGCIGLVLGAELLNTAIEQVVDLVSPDLHPSAGLIKDTAAGAVLVCAVVAAIIGCIVFVPKLFV
jgi:diacylglycerol kinase